MSTIIYPSPIFGPIHSRRLGISLGINLLPGDGKVCSFDCLYCECGLNAERRAHKPFPTREEVRTALRETLTKMKEEGTAPDVLTFAGNGEPTAHPEFEAIIDDTLALRDAFFPNAKVSVLSNATFIRRPAVFEALKKVDNNILKLDTVSDDFIRLVDRPQDVFELGALVEQMKRFDGHCIIQTMFLKGTDSTGRDVNNTSDAFVRPWIDVLYTIRPQQVMIYTIDRETPTSTLLKASREELDTIAAQVEAAGMNVNVAY